MAFRHAQTDHVFVLDADNALYPVAVERLLSACKNAGVQAAYSPIKMFGDQVGIGESCVWGPSRFAQHNYVDAMALIRKDAWEKAGGYALFSTSGWEDYYLWCSFIDSGMEAVFVPQILCRCRVHGKSMLRQETNKEEESARLEMIVRHPWLPTPLPTPVWRRRVELLRYFLENVGSIHFRSLLSDVSRFVPHFPRVSRLCLHLAARSRVGFLTGAQPRPI